MPRKPCAGRQGSTPTFLIHRCVRRFWNRQGSPSTVSFALTDIALVLRVNDTNQFVSRVKSVPGIPIPLKSRANAASRFEFQLFFGGGPSGNSAEASIKMAQKCVHKGCGKVFTDAEEDCVYHPGPPEFHEGQKGTISTRHATNETIWILTRARDRLEMLQTALSHL